MALSATFTANFSSFYDAVDKADAKLKDFGAGADKVGGKLTTFANQFSGVKIVQEATIMAKAVEEIGGVSKLTEKELARLGATTNEAVAKMKLLGMDVPKNLQQIADQTKHANTATTDWMGTLGKIAATVGVAFSVGAITNFIGSIFDAAGAIKDMSLQWGVSTDAVQKWTYAAKKSGVEAETVGKSIQFLTEHLSEGSKEYDALLANLGLSADKLRAMPIEEAYREVLTAIAGIKDETLQLDVALGIFGPNAKKMIGMVRDGFLETADAHKGWSKEMIDRLDEAEEKWGDFKNKVVLYSGEMLDSVMTGVSKMTSSWGTFFKAAGIAFTQGPLEAAKWIETQKAVTSLDTSLRGATGTLNTIATQGGDAADAIDGMYTGLVDLGSGFRGATTSGAAMTGGMKTTAQVQEELRQRTEALKKAEEERKKGLEEAKRVEEAHAAALKKQEDATNALINTFSGAGLIGKANDYIAALKMTIPIEQMTAAQKENINKVMADALAVYRALGETAPQVMHDIYAATAKAATALPMVQKGVEDILKLGGKGIAIDIVPRWHVEGLPPVPPIDLSAITDAKPKPGMFDKYGAAFSATLSESILRAVQGGGSILQAAGSSIGNFLLDPKQSGLGKSIETQVAKLPGLLGGAINAAIPVVGSLIGPAVSWLGGKIAGLFGQKEHNKLRDAFVESAGGITALTIAARDAGTSLDQLLGARNTDQVKKAIGELESAFAFQESAIDAAMEAAQRYGFTLEELGPALARGELDKQAQQLYKDFEVLNSAGLDSVAITERMGEEVSTYIQQAVKMGSEVPAAMRPMLESFAKAGTLVDENGEAITDLEAAGISFSMTMSDGFKALIGEVKLLTDAISRSLGLAIREIPQPKVRGEVSWDVKEIHAPSQAGGGEPLESYQKGTGGFRDFGAGTPVMLHGWEAVVPREESSGAFATVSPGAAVAAGLEAAPTIVINAQGAFFDTPGDLQRLAERVNEALTAKFGLRNAMRAG